MTLEIPNPNSEPQVTPPPATELETRLTAAEKKANDAYAKLRLLEKEHMTLKAKSDALESGTSKYEADKIAHMRLKKAYENSIPSDLFALVTGTTEAEIDAQIKIIQTQFAKAPAETPAPAPPGGEPVPNPANPQPTPRPAPVAPGGGPSWLEKYQLATPHERAKMDADVMAGKVKPW